MKAVSTLSLMTVMIATASIAAPLSPQSDALSLEALRNYGQCIVRTDARGPIAVLAMDYRTPEYRAKLRAIGVGFGRCVTPASELRSNSMLFAASLAEAMLNEQTRHPLAASLVYDSARPPVVARSPSETMALCVVRARPAGVAALIETPPGSRDEQAAMAPVGNVLPGCLAKGYALTLNRPALRGLLALAAYRVAVANGAVRGVASPSAGAN
jgi:hypothetical protein